MTSLHSLRLAAGQITLADRETFAAIEEEHRWPNYGDPDYQRGRIFPSERRVLRAARMGFSVPQTAALLYSAPETIKTHRQRAIQKLGARNIVHAVWLACEAGELEPPEVREVP